MLIRFGVKLLLFRKNGKHKRMVEHLHSLLWFQNIFPWMTNFAFVYVVKTCNYITQSLSVGRVELLCILPNSQHIISIAAYHDISEILLNINAIRLCVAWLCDFFIISATLHLLANKCKINQPKPNISVFWWCCLNLWCELVINTFQFWLTIYIMVICDLKFTHIWYISTQSYTHIS